jgi:hypothetical protein
VSQENNRIPVLIGDIKRESVGGYCVQNLKYNKEIFSPIVLRNNFDDAQVIHETIHNRGGGEFQAYAGMMAAGYYIDEVKSIIGYKTTRETAWTKDDDNYREAKYNMISELQKSAPKSFGFENYLNEKGDIKSLDNLIDNMKKYGNEIIGKKEK